MTAKQAAAPKPRAKSRVRKPVPLPDVETDAQKLARARQMLRDMTREAEETLASAMRTRARFLTNNG